MKLTYSLIGILFSLTCYSQKFYGMVPVGDNMWMDATEITVNEYRQFLNDLPEADRDKYKPDSTVWELDNLIGIPYYFFHPAYDNYPVVGISYEQVTAFCEWRTTAFNNVNKLQVRYRLPTMEEWNKIAFCGDEGFAGCLSSTFSAKTQTNMPYFQFNFWQGGVGMSGADGFIMVCPVDSYAPNQNGLYNLSGNVAEMVAEQGKALGGSWRHGAEFAQKGEVLKYSEPTAWLGFRCVVEVVK